MYYYLNEKQKIEDCVTPYNFLKDMDMFFIRHRRI